MLKRTPLGMKKPFDTRGTGGLFFVRYHLPLLSWSGALH